MIDDLKILMMGASGTGKTCYMLAMYAAMSASLRGFTFATQDLDDDLELTDRWEDMLLQGNWPAPNKASKNWAFDCSYGFRKIMGFRWYDYRGGVLRERQEVEDVREFRQKVKEASCVILCVAGDELAAYVDGGSEPKGLRQFNAQMNEFYKERKDVIPVVVAITKADQCPAEKIIDGIEQLNRGLLSSLFVEGPRWLVMFCPVSLGLGLSGPENPNCKGLIKPVNVHIPVIYPIYFNLQAEIDQRERAIAEFENARQRSQEEVDRLEGGLLTSIFKRRDIRSGKTQIDAIQKEMKMTEKEAEEFKNSLKRIREDLMADDIFIYHNGHRVNLKTD
jgi:hypothetical protein